MTALNVTTLRILAGGLAVVAAGCSTLASGPARPPRPAVAPADAVAAAFEPMLIVPLPALDPAPDTTRSLDALQARQSPLGDVLAALFVDSDLDLWVEPEVRALPCTIDLRRATVEQAFEALLAGLDLGWEWDGRLLRVSRTLSRTLHVDLMDGADGAPAAGFWDQITGMLPTLLGEGATFVVNRAGSTIHVQARPSAIRRVAELVDTTRRAVNRQVSFEAHVLEVAVAGAPALPGGVTTGVDFPVLVEALRRRGQVRVLSSPRAVTMNDQLVSIAVTDQVPYVTRAVFDDHGVVRTEFGVGFVDAGIALQVRPRIGADGLISCAITPQVRERTGSVTTPDGVVVAPVIAERSATAVVRVADGQAITLGGLRSTRPHPGGQGGEEVELVVVLVPHVLDDASLADGMRRGGHRLVRLGPTPPAKDAAIRATGDVVPAPQPGPGLTITRRGLAAHLATGAQRALDGGDPAAALAALERVLALDPDRPDALVACGVLHERRGNRARGRTLLDRAVELRPDDPIAATVRGTIEMADASPRNALRFLRRAHELGGSALTASNLGAALVAAGECEAARQLLRDVAGTTPPELHVNRALAELAAGDGDAARASLRRALDAGADPRNPRVLALEQHIGRSGPAASAAAAPGL